MTGPLEVDDAVVLLLGAPSDSPTLENRLEGVTRLEKLLFLLERETDVGSQLDEDLSFVSHNFGPFSSKVYGALDVLSAAGLIIDSRAIADAPTDTWETQEIIGLDADDPYATRDFSLTDRGRRYYAALLNELEPEAEEELRRFKDRFGGLPLRQLIRYVYQKYPQFTDRSRIRDQVLG